ncbi:hypothetical protein T459_26833 [Capsicum annuum]|uniref:Ubiquitin-like protease family profile domain-containing protein n=1 Tax=Capsicum annuum TaxID=4072 RepID=A0A2G2YC75_CAPAN|nr:hypothetical protein T459_26833 [Capsicum annuum]
MKVDSVERSICEIIQRLCIPASISWHLIDEVYVPINCQRSLHWVLVVIVLKKRCIHVYDSLKGHRGHDVEIKELVEMLSTYLTISDFFEKKERTDWSLQEAYKKKWTGIHLMFTLLMVLCNKKSGTFDGHQIPSSEFDPEMDRTIYTSLLWDYGVNEASNGYVSDNQDPPRPERTFIPAEDTEMIDAKM